MNRIRGYTLIEILVAMAIIVVLVGLFMPVLSQAKEGARTANCILNNRQVYFASTIYQVDYDDRYVVPKYAVNANESSVNDRTWVQLVAPYLRNLQLTRCPSDYTRPPGVDPVFDADLISGVNAEKFYQSSQRANTGMNFVYLSPMVREPDGTWTAHPRSTSEALDPSKTLVFGDSVWDVGPDGQPSGGGSYLIVPPCRWNASDGSDSFGLSSYLDNRVFTASIAWDDAGKPNSAHFGGLWPWHSGKLTTVMADGSVKQRSISQVSDGCKVLSGWQGKIYDPSRYLWDLR